jgi:hypothetical protein
MILYKQLLLPCPDTSFERDIQTTNGPPSAYQRYVVEQVKSKKESALKGDLVNRLGVIGWMKSCQGSLLLAETFPLSSLSVLCGSTPTHPFPPSTITFRGERSWCRCAEMRCVLVIPSRLYGHVPQTADHRVASPAAAAHVYAMAFAGLTCASVGGESTPF